MKDCSGCSYFLSVFNGSVKVYSHRKTTRTKTLFYLYDMFDNNFIVFVVFIVGFRDCFCRSTRALAPRGGRLRRPTGFVLFFMRCV